MSQAPTLDTLDTSMRACLALSDLPETPMDMIYFAFSEMAERRPEQFPGLSGDTGLYFSALERCLFLLSGSGSLIIQGVEPNSVIIDSGVKARQLNWFLSNLTPRKLKEARSLALEFETIIRARLSKEV